jgi:hypothetical protein
MKTAGELVILKKHLLLTNMILRHRERDHTRWIYFVP